MKKNNRRLKKALTKFNGSIMVLLALFLFSCGPTVSTTKMTTKDLSNYQTFAYLPNSNFDDLELATGDKTVGISVIEAVNNNMKKLGYTIDKENPDLLVLLATKTNTEKYSTTEPVYATYPRYYGSAYGVSPYYQNYYYGGYYNYRNIVGYDKDIETYKEGALILTLVDRNSKNVVWRGKASDVIVGQNESVAIASYVDDLFSEYPVKK